VNAIRRMDLGGQPTITGTVCGHLFYEYHVGQVPDVSYRCPTGPANGNRALAKNLDNKSIFFSMELEAPCP